MRRYVLSEDFNLLLIHMVALSHPLFDAVHKFIDELAPQLFAKKVTIKLSAPARLWLAEKGFDPHFGARPLDRLIQKEIKDVLTDQILFGRLTDGGAVYVKVKDNKLMFNYS
jgi:ATP-dependent Clp protease ATP-binding subunit ClpA